MKVRLIDKISNKVDKPEAYIKTGKIYVNNQKIENVNYLVGANDIIQIQDLKKYVSRGAYKLLAAIDHFNLNFTNKVVVDIGSSTGGFTQVALESGAQKVYALDVGTNQLDFQLRKDPRVVVMEKTNLKIIKKSMFVDKINIFVVDVSFISLRSVFDVLASFNNIIVMALIKPQFESCSNQVDKGGFVDETKHSQIINKIKLYAISKQFICQGVHLSPIVGLKSKNKEYISLFTRK